MMAFRYKLMDKWGLTLLSMVVGLGLLYFVSGDMIPSASAQSGQEEAGVVEINQAQFAGLVCGWRPGWGQPAGGRRRTRPADHAF